MKNAEQVLRFSNVIDAQDRWTGDVDFVVQVGNIIDGWAQSFYFWQHIQFVLTCFTEDQIQGYFLIGWMDCVCKLS
jgi:hypothetical protein